MASPAERLPCHTVLRQVNTILCGLIKLAWMDQITGQAILDPFCDAIHAIGHDGQPHRHGLGQATRQSFPQRGHEKDIHRRQQAAHVSAQPGQ